MFAAVAGVIGVIILVVLLVFGFAALFAFPVMWLWNYVVPGIFHLPVIDFWHALALSVLCSLLFKSYNYSSK